MSEWERYRRHREDYSIVKGAVVELLREVQDIEFTPLVESLKRSKLPEESVSYIRESSAGLLSLDQFLSRTDLNDAVALGLEKVNRGLTMSLSEM